MSFHFPILADSTTIQGSLNCTFKIEQQHVLSYASKELEESSVILNINSISYICEFLKEDGWLVRRHLLKNPEDGIKMTVTDVGSIGCEKDAVMLQTAGTGEGQMLMSWNRQSSEIVSAFVNKNAHLNLFVISHWMIFISIELICHVLDVPVLNTP